MLFLLLLGTSPYVLTVGFLRLLSLSSVSLQKLSISIRFQGVLEKAFNFSIPCQVKKKRSKKKSNSLKHKCVFSPALKFSIRVFVYFSVCRRGTYVSVCAFMCASYWTKPINTIGRKYDCVFALKILFYLLELAWYFCFRKKIHSFQRKSWPLNICEYKLL